MIRTMVIEDYEEYGKRAAALCGRGIVAEGRFMEKEKSLSKNL